MRVLAHLRGAPSGGRMAHAVSGLALRGHEVAWAGSVAPAAARRLRGFRDLSRFDAQVVASDGPSPAAAALTGWLAGARCLVMSLDHGSARRWGLASRWAWHSLHPLGLVAPEEGEAFRADPAGLELDRLGLWSDEPPALEADPAHPDTEILERACERALARHLGRAPRPAVFLDRDGTLVKEVGYLADPGDLEILPGVGEALRGLRTGGYALVVVSNQSGVGRGFFGLGRVHEAMARLRTGLRGQGVELDGVYFCPHRPDAGCACRKPGTALLSLAAADLHLSLRDSVMVGDKLLDVETAHRAGAAGILVRTGYGRDEEARAGDLGRAPDSVCDDLRAAAGWILERAGRE